MHTNGLEAPTGSIWLGRVWRTVLLFGVAAVFLLGNESLAWDGGPACGLHCNSGHDIKFPGGVYYPGPYYYSRAYLQAFPVQPGQYPLYYRLQPFQDYARVRLGTPFPNLTNGSVQSDRFPYRYQPFFEARRPGKDFPVEFCPPRQIFLSP